MKKKAKFTVSLNFQGIKLPPFQDILLLGRKCPHGKAGISGCLNLLAPDNFDLVELNDPIVEAMLVSKQILKRMPAEKVIEVLRDNVFPFIDKGEIVKVDFKVMISYDAIEGTL